MWPSSTDAELKPIFLWSVIWQNITENYTLTFFFCSFSSQIPPPQIFFWVIIYCFLFPGPEHCDLMVFLRVFYFAPKKCYTYPWLLDDVLYILFSCYGQVQPITLCKPSFERRQKNLNFAACLVKKSCKSCKKTEIPEMTNFFLWKFLNYEKFKICENR